MLRFCKARRKGLLLKKDTQIQRLKAPTIYPWRSPVSPPRHPPRIDPPIARSSTPKSFPSEDGLGIDAPGVVCLSILGEGVQGRVPWGIQDRAGVLFRAGRYWSSGAVEDAPVSFFFDLLFCACFWCLLRSPCRCRTC